MTSTADADARRASPEQLSVLDPLGALSPIRLRELANVTIVERAARGSDPLAAHKGTGHSIFLLRGELLLMYEGGGTLVVVGSMGHGRHPLNRGGAKIGRSKAISEVELLAVEDEALDILVTFDQVATGGGVPGSAMAEAVRSDAGLVSGIFHFPICGMACSHGCLRHALKECSRVSSVSARNGAMSSSGKARKATTTT